MVLSEAGNVQRSQAENRKELLIPLKGEGKKFVFNSKSNGMTVEVQKRTFS